MFVTGIYLSIQIIPCWETKKSFKLFFSRVAIQGIPKKDRMTYLWKPSITDGVHRKDNFVEIIPVFSIFSNFFRKKINKL